MTPVLELCWGTVMAAGFDELVDAAAGSGFGSIAVNARMYERARSGSTDADLRRRLDDAGVRVGYLDAAVQGLPGMPEVPADVARRSEEVCYEALAALGAPAFNLHHYTGRRVPLPHLVDAVGAVAARARTHGASVVLEFIPGTGIPDLATAREIIAAVGADNVSVLLDTWHHWRSGGRLEHLRALPPGAVGAVQLSDVPADRVDTWRPDDPEADERNAQFAAMTGRLLPGEGVIPLGDVVRALLDVCPEVPIGIELFNEELSRRPAGEVAGLCAASMRRLLP